MSVEAPPASLVTEVQPAIHATGFREVKDGDIRFPGKRLVGWSAVKPSSRLSLAASFPGNAVCPLVRGHTR
ncbi:MAG: hypothetical protein KIH01_03050 [Candidatus Freyarchaeota archaeon]|nr:hypothetical protein [Candidatus Jordarchaeia archaeon]